MIRSVREMKLNRTKQKPLKTLRGLQGKWYQWDEQMLALTVKPESYNSGSNNHPTTTYLVPKDVGFYICPRSWECVRDDRGTLGVESVDLDLVASENLVLFHKDCNFPTSFWFPTCWFGISDLEPRTIYYPICCFLRNHHFTFLLAILFIISWSLCSSFVK